MTLNGHIFTVTAVDILHLLPFLTIAQRSFSLLTLTEITAVTMGKRQRQQNNRAVVRQRVQIAGERQNIAHVRIDQRAISKTQAYCLRFQLSGHQGIAVKEHIRDPPRMTNTKLRNAVIAERFPAGLLLKLLRGQECPLSPQWSMNFHITPLPGQAFAFGIWETSDRLISIPSIWKCGTAKSLTRKKPGLSSISSTITLPSRSG